MFDVLFRPGSSRPWRKMHFPLMRVYASAAGCERGLAETFGRDFSVHGALRILLVQARGMSQEEADAYTEKQLARCGSLEDLNAVKAALRAQFPALDERDRQRMENEATQLMSYPDPSFQVRSVIAGLIEDQLGPEHRIEYLVAVLLGKAF